MHNRNELLVIRLARTKKAKTMQDENHTSKAEQKKKNKLRKLVGLASFLTKNLCRSKSQTLNMISRNLHFQMNEPSLHEL